MKKIIYLVFLTILVSCSQEPEPIDYGNEACHFCEMTIVNPAFSAQAVSTKGKQYKYDAIECMVNDLLQKDIEMAVLKVADHSRPGSMIDAEKAAFIINDSIKSPMGANLAALKRSEVSPNNESGRVLTWAELNDHFLQKDSVITNY
ncbi:nitrous oxide reductase accessory protein NosL [Salinimicrobium catena]|uniref:nitrous oxide reductase accessory protein NosL n=1 Tax=Salinimicrobium catena TaxID=390640 RepID=UPI002FE48734